MIRNYYSEINLHITWHTKDSMPLLTPMVEPLAYRAIRGKIMATPGVSMHEIGGTETHVHVSVSVPPTIVVSDFIGQIKGASSYEVNQQLKTRGNVLQWQAGYGVISFGNGNLQWVTQYIQHQREHHAGGKISERLERFDTPAEHDDDRSPVNGTDSNVVISAPQNPA
jgi:putative transposase